MSTLLENLNPEQLQAVTHVDGPLLIVAGAGTGKTTVITRRIAYIIEQKLAKPEEILALTFTDKAAGEMESRVDQILPLGSYDLWISTFHSFCERILKQHGLDIGIPNDFKLLDDVQQWVLVHRNLDKFKLDYYRPLGNPNKFIDALLSHFSKCKDEMVTPEGYLEYAEKLKLAGGNVELPLGGEGDKATEIKRIEEIAGAYHVYQKLLLDNEYLDFGDLINYCMELFKRRPNILKYYQQKFKFVMVDEFQDTNFAQYQLVKLLSPPKVVSPSFTKITEGKQQSLVVSKNNQNSKTNDYPLTTNNLVVVGDDDQSIYKFRGASVSNILKLKEEYEGVREITLTQNYRSSQNILDLAYNFIQNNNPNRLESKLGIDKRLKSNIPDEGVIQVLEGKDLSEELDLVIKKVVELKNNNPDCNWNDFAVLVRANSAAEEVLSRLDTAGITYTFLANRGLYRKKVVADLISYMKLLDNFHENGALYRVLNLPKFAVPPKDISTITSHLEKKTLSLYEAFAQARAISGLSEESVKSIETITGLLHQHAEFTKSHTTVEVFITLVHDLGIINQLEEDTATNAESREYLEQFYKKIEGFEEQNPEDKSLKNFIATLILEIQAGSEGSIKFDPNLGPESLKVMTVHSAKGLEFKFVFIINMVDQRFPSRAQHDAIELPEALIQDILPEGDFHLQEERRLFYVALTRAKTHLFLSWGRDYGGNRTKKPSIFLQETKLVPSEKVQTATGKVIFNKHIDTKKLPVYEHLPTKFSFTDISMFENCPLEYKFKRYLKLPMPGTAHLSFGQTIHRTLEKFALEYKLAQEANQQTLFGGGNESKLPEFKRLETLYDELWVDEWYKTKKEKEEYRVLGKTMLKTAYDDFIMRKPVIKYIEQEFSLPLGEYKFVGKIDRIDSLNGGVEIIDYKTGSTPKTKGKRDVDQLRIYQWAAQEYLKEEVAVMYYWHLKDNQKRDDPTATPQELADLQNSLLETIEDIRHTITFDLFSQKHTQSKTHKCNFAEYL